MFPPSESHTLLRIALKLSEMFAAVISTMGFNWKQIEANLSKLLQPLCVVRTRPASSTSRQLQSPQNSFKFDVVLIGLNLDHLVKF